LAASLPPLLMVSELLLVNQFPDVDADRQVGRRHFPIVWGRRRSALLFGAMVAAAYAALAIGVGCAVLPRLALLGVLPAPLGLFLARQVYRYADDLPRLVTYLGINVAMIHITLLLMAVGLLFG
jgi:1,4-dihydroxy-2-naphthoate octaprenyltransferase